VMSGVDKALLLPVGIEKEVCKIEGGGC